MNFRSNGLRYGKRACIVSWNDAIFSTCVCPGMGVNAVCGVLVSWPHKVFHFPSAKTGLFVKQVRGEQTMVERSLCTTLEQHIHNTFNTLASL
jgi:hypothetical protein